MLSGRGFEVSGSLVGCAGAVLEATTSFGWLEYLLQTIAPDTPQYMTTNMVIINARKSFGTVSAASHRQNGITNNRSATTSRTQPKAMLSTTPSNCNAQINKVSAIPTVHIMPFVEIFLFSDTCHPSTTFLHRANKNQQSAATISFRA